MMPKGLDQIVRTGWYRQVQVKSLDSHLNPDAAGGHASGRRQPDPRPPQDLWLGAGEGGSRNVRSPVSTN
jgi:hypothetical protein